MGRRKEPEVTRAAILDAAFRVFAAKGYESASVSDILVATGLSKGAFYHHFQSKDELLDAVIERLTYGAVAEVRAAVEAAPDALGQLECFVSASRRWRLSHVAAARLLMPLVMGEGAVKLRDRLSTRAVDASTPLFAGVLETGAAEGTFDVVDPEATARQLLQLGQVVGRDQGKDVLRGDAKAIVERAHVYLCNVERIVGIDEGTLSRPTRRAVAKFIKALKEAS